MIRFIFAASLRGDEHAARLHAEKEEAGYTIIDNHEEILGILVRVIEVHGKRPNEGQIAADMKARKA